MLKPLPYSKILGRKTAEILHTKDEKEIEINLSDKRYGVFTSEIII